MYAVMRTEDGMVEDRKNIVVIAHKSGFPFWSSGAADLIGSTRQTRLRVRPVGHVTFLLFFNALFSTIQPLRSPFNCAPSLMSQKLFEGGANLLPLRGLCSV